MAVAIFIAILLLSLVVLVVYIKHRLFISNIMWNFKHCNCIVYGKKGTGKDVVFDNVIEHRKEPHYANIPYNDKTEVIKIKDVSCYPNDYEHIVNDKIEPQEHRFIEGKDIYISDIGIFLPSYMDSKLYKQFPSMPVFYALSRHLYNNNVHCNTQNLERGWKALREQADFYVCCKRTYKLPFILITKIITYDKYESAKQGLLPIKSRLLNKYSKAEVDVYNASNGDIRSGHMITLKKNIHYDTRAFEKVLLKGERLLSR